MANPSVYVETSLVSYLAARPSRDLVTASRQQITHEWWHERRRHFDLFISPLVLREASRGDPAYAERRLEYLRDLPLLKTRPEAAVLAQALLERGPLPQKAQADAAHIALAAVHGVDYLLTWNCKHIANAEMQPMLRRICEAHGVAMPLPCTPEQLMGGA